MVLQSILSQQAFKDFPNFHTCSLCNNTIHKDDLQVVRAEGFLPHMARPEEAFVIETPIIKRLRGGNYTKHPSDTAKWLLRCPKCFCSSNCFKKPEAKTKKKKSIIIEGTCCGFSKELNNQIIDCQICRHSTAFPVISNELLLSQSCVSCGKQCGLIDKPRFIHGVYGVNFHCSECKTYTFFLYKHFGASRIEREGAKISDKKTWGIFEFS